MSVFVIRGCSIGDNVFSTDPAIFGVEITWNVTRIQRDTDAGRFGKPETQPVSILPPMSSLANANVDWDKVAAMVAGYRTDPERSVLQKPSLQVAVAIGETLYRIPIDGNHRICARRLVGLPDFAFYTVPSTMERHYRVTGLPSMSGGYSK